MIVASSPRERRSRNNSAAETVHFLRALWGSGEISYRVPNPISQEEAGEFMATTLDTLAEILGGASITLLGSLLAQSVFRLEPGQFLTTVAYLSGILGIASLAALFVSVSGPKPSSRTTEVPSGAFAVSSNDVEKYSRLLARLEELRAQQSLPEAAYLSLRDDYLQKLSIALEGSTKVC
jgi:hypothetical protein